MLAHTSLHYRKGPEQAGTFSERKLRLLEMTLFPVMLVAIKTIHKPTQNIRQLY